MAPWLGIMLISLLLATVIAGLRIYQQHYNPHPEWVRKILHILMGLVALSFPWIFSTTWPVWTLAAIATGGLLLLKLQSLPGADWGGVVHGVKRLSLGEFYFPIAIAGIFQLAQGNIILYSIPILVLTLADATAALIGVYYGKSKYHATDGDKSVEGSAAFFTIAFLSVHIPLLLFTDIGRADCLLIGFIMGVLVMLFEALAWRGLDNLFIPFGSFFLLDIYWDMPTADLLRRFGIVVAILLSLPLFRRLTTFNDSAAIGVALVGYVSWALGGLSWLLPPSIVFVAYTVLNPSAGQEKRDSHDLRAVFTVSSAGLFWLFIHRIWHQELFLFFFTLAFAANLAMLGIVREGYRHSQWTGLSIIAWGATVGWLLLFMPYLALLGFSPAAWMASLYALPVVSIAAILFYYWQPDIRECPSGTGRWIRQATIAGGASVSGLPLFL